MKAKSYMCARLILSAITVTLAFLPAALDGAQVRDQAETAYAGEWEGRLAQLQLKVPIKLVDGRLTATLVVVSQGNATIPADSVALAAGKIVIEFKRIGATFTASLSTEGNELTGTWQQGGNTMPLIVRRPGASTARFTVAAKNIGAIAFQPCRAPDGNTEGLCAKYAVYENRQRRSGGRIDLNIMVLPSIAANPAPDPFVPFAGGPGQAAMDAFTSPRYTAQLRQSRDIVLIDQRGTGGSSQLACALRDPNNAQQVISEDFPIERLRMCREELEKRADLTQYTTSIAVDDVDEIRAAMGYEKINIFGQSYGSRAALEYLRRHGSHVRTIALEGVVPPNFRIPLSFARTTDESLDALMARCRNDESCNASYPNLTSEFREIVNRLDKNPARAEVLNPAGVTQRVTITRATFVGDLRVMLYIPELVSQFPFVIHEAYKGNWKLFAQAALQIRSLIDRNLTRAESLSVICSEDIPGITEAIIRRETGGTYLGDLQVLQFQATCREWPQGQASTDLHSPVHSSVPALLVSGALDPATPPSISVDESRDLRNSRVVIVKNGTHGTGSPCIDGLIVQFVNSGSARDFDDSCAAQIKLPAFLTLSAAEAIQNKVQ